MAKSHAQPKAILAFDQVNYPFPHKQPHLTGIHAGYAYAVFDNNCGNYNGYVAIPEGHPWHGKPYDAIDCDCHGGLTFSCTTDDGVHWVGFDTAHLGDSAHPDLLKQMDPKRAAIFSYTYDESNHAWSIKEVAAECLNICDQAAAAKPVKD